MATCLPREERVCVHVCVRVCVGKAGGKARVQKCAKSITALLRHGCHRSVSTSSLPFVWE